MHDHPKEKDLVDLMNEGILEFDNYKDVTLAVREGKVRCTSCRKIFPKEQAKQYAKKYFCSQSCINDYKVYK